MSWSPSTAESKFAIIPSVLYISTAERESVRSRITMLRKRCVRRVALVLVVLVSSAVLGSATAVAAGLGDYLWERRPVLVFAPTDSDRRLVETRSRIEASRCAFVDRDMVLGVVVTGGNSTLDGQVVSADESQRLRKQYGIGANAFSVLLIGKDGGEKLR